jgi:hypothetical protein
VDARVRLQRRGLAGCFNQKRQWVGVRFTVSTPDGIVVDKTRARRSLRRAGARHRRTAPMGAQPGRPAPGESRRGRHPLSSRARSLFIREGATGLQIRTTETQALTPGDQVEVLGFPALGTYSAVLEDAVFRRTGHVDDPRPSPATPEQMLRGEWDASLVAVRGVLLESVRQHGAQSLVMQAGDIIFHARLGGDRIGSA